MKEITKERIIKDLRISFSCTLNLISMLLGIGLVCLPVLQSEKIDENTVMSALVMFVSFGLLFGIYFGLRLLLKNLKRLKCIRQGDVTIERDTLIDKEHVNSRTDEELQCLLTFEKYSGRSGHGVLQPRKIYKQVRKGDEFYLVYVGREEVPLRLYPVKEYSYHGTLN